MFRPRPGEKCITAHFRKENGPPEDDEATGVILDITGEEKAVKKFIEVLDKAIPNTKE
jgi:hypothetical protein